MLAFAIMLTVVCGFLFAMGLGLSVYVAVTKIRLARERENARDPASHLAT